MPNFFKQIGGFITKNSPTLLTGVSVAGVFTTAILAVTATPKAIELMEDAQYEKASKVTTLYEEDIYYAKKVAPLTTMEAIQATWKCYIPAVIMGGVTIGCIVGLNSIHLRRNAALAGLYSLSETALKEYQAKVKQTLGENKHREIKEGMVKDKIQNHPVNDKEVIITGLGDTLCYDAQSGRYFKSDIENIRKVINKLNRELIQDSPMTLNELYDLLDLQGTKLGEVTGWHVNDGMIEPRFSSTLTTDGRPCLVLDFEEEPIPLYRD